MCYFSDTLAYKDATSIEDSTRKGTRKHSVPERVGKDEGQDNGSQQSDAGGQPWTRSLTCKMGFNQQYLPAQRHGGVGEKKEKKGKKKPTPKTQSSV